MKEPGSTESVVLVVIESGARWPGWARELAASVEDLIVLAADSNDTPAELALRVIRRIGALEREGRAVQMGVLVSADVVDDEVFASRCLVARAFLSHMALSGTGEMIFAASEDLGGGARHDLLALASTLTDQLFGTRLSLSVRFGEPREELASGVRLKKVEVLEGRDERFAGVGLGPAQRRPKPGDLDTD